VEEDIHLDRRNIHERKIDADIVDWILDLGSSRARDTKYWTMVDLYWHIKTFVGKVLQDREDDREEILTQLAEVKQQLQEIKSTILACA
jgi:hypothetical protein